MKSGGRTGRQSAENVDLEGRVETHVGLVGFMPQPQNGKEPKRLQPRNHGASRAPGTIVTAQT
jgi:hypothetical protein